MPGARPTQRARFSKERLGRAGARKPTRPVILGRHTRTAMPATQRPSASGRIRDLGRIRADVTAVFDTGRGALLVASISLLKAPCRRTYAKPGFLVGWPSRLSSTSRERASRRGFARAGESGG